jgi:hypothetical protein
MRPQDKKVFLEAAAHFHAYIIVRHTNVASLKYVGKAGYTPKAIDCKAKTADHDLGRYKLAGLVVDPGIHGPHVYKGGKLAEAQKCWKAMEGHVGPGKKYTVETNSSSPHYGCLKCHGAFVHGDYDLYDIIDTRDPKNNAANAEQLLGQIHMRGALVNEVAAYVNQRIGSPMVQHGGEAQYKDHSEQYLDFFGPNGEDVTWLNEFTARERYKNDFMGRPTLSHGTENPYRNIAEERRAKLGPPTGPDAKVLPFRNWY